MTAQEYKWFFFFWDKIIDDFEEVDLIIRSKWWSVWIWKIIKRKEICSELKFVNQDLPENFFAKCPMVSV